jgi:hypothetical protein
MPMDAMCMAMILLDMNCRVVIYSAADHLINPSLKIRVASPREIAMAGNLVAKNVVLPVKRVTRWKRTNGEDGCCSSHSEPTKKKAFSEYIHPPRAVLRHSPDMAAQIHTAV